MSFGDHAVLWLHVTAAIFTIGPGTAAIMSTPHYIRKQNPVVLGYLLRSTRIYSFASLLTLIFGLILAGMTHKFSQWWISVSLTLFVVAFVLLVIIMRDQRKALATLKAEEATADRVGVGVRSEAAAGTAAEAVAAGDVQPAASARHHTPATAGELRVAAAVERGRIASLGGLTALLWVVILVLMVWR